MRMLALATETVLRASLKVQVEKCQGQGGERGDSGVHRDADRYRPHSRCAAQGYAPGAYRHAANSGG